MLDGFEVVPTHDVELKVAESSRYESPRERGTRGSNVVQRLKEMKCDEGFNAQSEHCGDLVNARDRVCQGRAAALQDAAPYRLLLTHEEAVTSQLAESRAELITAAART
jgi:hypothetical protein